MDLGDDVRPELIFLHVPKCAGATFEGILGQVYGEIFVSTFEHGEQVPDGIRCVSGHFTHGRIRAEFSDIPLVTILRRPTERVISNYRFLRRSVFPNHQPWVQELRDGNLDIIQYAEIETERNVMATYVPLNSLQDFAWIGIKERFRHSLSSFLRWFAPGVEIVYESVNVAPNYQDEGFHWSDGVNPMEALTRIRKLNSEDWEIYRWAVMNWGPRLKVRP